MATVGVKGLNPVNVRGTKRMFEVVVLFHSPGGLAAAAAVTGDGDGRVISCCSCS